MEKKPQTPMPLFNYEDVQELSLPDEHEDIPELLDPRDSNTGPVFINPDVIVGDGTYVYKGVVTEGHGMQPMCPHCHQMAIALNVSTISKYKVVSCRYCYQIIGVSK